MSSRSLDIFHHQAPTNNTELLSSSLPIAIVDHEEWTTIPLTNIPSATNHGPLLPSSPPPPSPVATIMGHEEWTTIPFAEELPPTKTQSSFPPPPPPLLPSASASSNEEQARNLQKPTPLYPVAPRLPPPALILTSPTPPQMLAQLVRHPAPYSRYRHRGATAHRQHYRHLKFFTRYPQNHFPMPRPMPMPISLSTKRAEYDLEAQSERMLSSSSQGFEGFMRGSWKLGKRVWVTLRWIFDDEKEWWEYGLE